MTRRLLRAVAGPLRRLITIIRIAFAHAGRWLVKRFHDVARARRAILQDTDNWILGGLVLLAIGLGEVYPPAAWIAPGVVICALGIWLSLPGGRKRGD